MYYIVILQLSYVQSENVYSPEIKIALPSDRVVVHLRTFFPSLAI